MLNTLYWTGIGVAMIFAIIVNTEIYYRFSCSPEMEERRRKFLGRAEDKNFPLRVWKNGGEKENKEKMS